MAIIKGNPVLKQFCKHRYYPLLRELDENLGTGFKLLQQVIPEYKKNHKFGIKLITFYGLLGELKTIQPILEMPCNSQYIVFQKITELPILNQLIELESNGLKQMEIRTIHFHL